MFSDWNFHIPSLLQKRLLKFLIKKSIGHYIDCSFDLDQLDINYVYLPAESDLRDINNLSDASEMPSLQDAAPDSVLQFGVVTLIDLSLSLEKVNEDITDLTHIPIKMTTGSIQRLRIQVPVSKHALFADRSATENPKEDEEAVKILLENVKLSVDITLPSSDQAVETIFLNGSVLAENILKLTQSTAILADDFLLENNEVIEDIAGSYNKEGDDEELGMISYLIQSLIRRLDITILNLEISLNLIKYTLNDSIERKNLKLDPLSSVSETLCLSLNRLHYSDITQGGHSEVLFDHPLESLNEVISEESAAKIISSDLPETTKKIAFEGAFLSIRSMPGIQLVSKTTEQNTLLLYFQNGKFGSERKLKNSPSINKLGNNRNLDPSPIYDSWYLELGEWTLQTIPLTAKNISFNDLQSLVQRLSLFSDIFLESSKNMRTSSGDYLTEAPTLVPRPQSSSIEKENALTHRGSSNLVPTQGNETLLAELENAAAAPLSGPIEHIRHGKQVADYTSESLSPENLDNIVGSNLSCSKGNQIWGADSTNVDGTIYYSILGTPNLHTTNSLDQKTSINLPIAESQSSPNVISFDISQTLRPPSASTKEKDHKFPVMILDRHKMPHEGGYIKLHKLIIPYILFGKEIIWNLSNFILQINSGKEMICKISATLAIYAADICQVEIPVIFSRFASSPLQYTPTSVPPISNLWKLEIPACLTISASTIALFMPRIKGDNAVNSNGELDLSCVFQKGLEFIASNSSLAANLEIECDALKLFYGDETHDSMNEELQLSLEKIEFYSGKFQIGELILYTRANAKGSVGDPIDAWFPLFKSRGLILKAINQTNLNLLEFTPQDSLDLNTGEPRFYQYLYDETTVLIDGKIRWPVPTKDWHSLDLMLKESVSLSGSNYNPFSEADSPQRHIERPPGFRKFTNYMAIQIHMNSLSIHTLEKEKWNSFNSIFFGSIPNIHAVNCSSGPSIFEECINILLPKWMRLYCFIQNISISTSTVVINSYFSEKTERKSSANSLPAFTFMFNEVTLFLDSISAILGIAEIEIKETQEPPLKVDLHTTDNSSYFVINWKALSSNSHMSNNMLHKTKFSVLHRLGRNAPSPFPLAVDPNKGIPACLIILKGDLCSIALNSLSLRNMWGVSATLYGPTANATVESLRAALCQISKFYSVFQHIPHIQLAFSNCTFEEEIILFEGIDLVSAYVDNMHLSLPYFNSKQNEDQTLNTDVKNSHHVAPAHSKHSMYSSNGEPKVDNVTKHQMEPLVFLTTWIHAETITIRHKFRIAAENDLYTMVLSHVNFYLHLCNTEYPELAIIQDPYRVQPRQEFDCYSLASTLEFASLECPSMTPAHMAKVYALYCFLFEEDQDNLSRKGIFSIWKNLNSTSQNLISSQIGEAMNTKIANNFSIKQNGSKKSIFKDENQFELTLEEDYLNLQRTLSTGSPFQSTFHQDLFYPSGVDVQMENIDQVMTSENKINSTTGTLQSISLTKAYLATEHSSTYVSASLSPPSICKPPISPVLNLFYTYLNQDRAPVENSNSIYRLHSSFIDILLFPPRALFNEHHPIEVNYVNSSSLEPFQTIPAVVEIQTSRVLPIEKPPLPLLHINNPIWRIQINIKQALIELNSIQFSKNEKYPSLSKFLQQVIHIQGNKISLELELYNSMKYPSEVSFLSNTELSQSPENVNYEIGDATLYLLPQLSYRIPSVLSGTIGSLVVLSVPIKDVSHLSTASHRSRRPANYASSIRSTVDTAGSTVLMATPSSQDSHVLSWSLLDIILPPDYIVRGSQLDTYNSSSSDDSIEIKMNPIKQPLTDSRVSVYVNPKSDINVLLDESVLFWMGHYLELYADISNIIMKPSPASLGLGHAPSSHLLEECKKVVDRFFQFVHISQVKFTFSYIPRQSLSVLLTQCLLSITSEVTKSTPYNTHDHYNFNGNSRHHPGSHINTTGANFSKLFTGLLPLYNLHVTLPELRLNGISNGWSSLFQAVFLKSYSETYSLDNLSNSVLESISQKFPLLKSMGIITSSMVQDILLPLFITRASLLLSGLRRQPDITHLAHTHPSQHRVIYPLVQPTSTNPSHLRPPQYSNFSNTIGRESSSILDQLRLALESLNKKWSP